MASIQRDIKTFFRVLPKMGLFWTFLVLMIGGLALSFWFNIRFLGATWDELPFPMLVTFGIGMSIFIYLCYQVYTGKIPQSPTEEQKPHFRAMAVRECIATIPLLFGAIATFYLLATNQIGYISVVLMPSLAMWLLLRFLLGRLLLGKKPKAPSNL